MVTMKYRSVRLLICTYLTALTLLPLISAYCLQEPTLCSFCRGLAKCYHNQTVVIPQKLPHTVDTLDILYSGVFEVTLTKSMFAKYCDLTSISLAGPKVVALSKGTFQSLNKLRELRVKYTAITDIPENLLPDNNRITILDLSYNQLKAIPKKLFLHLRQLESLNLGFNNITNMDCTSIGSSFHSLPNLKSLDMSKAKVDRGCELNVADTFFDPIQQSIEKLSLIGTNLLKGEIEEIFFNLTLLQLDISLAEGFSSCPGAASNLFRNLPPSLELLTIQRWRLFDGHTHSQQCQLNETSIQGLKDLPNLRILDLKYSDYIFGHYLEASVFSGFKSLEQLDLGWGRFSFVDEYALDGCSNLTWVSFEGNPVNSKSAILFKTQSKLSTLQLSRATLSADYARAYNFSLYLINSPIKVVDLRYNYLLYIPTLTTNLSRSYHTVEEIYLDENYLSDFKSLNGNISLETYCGVFPSLKVLTASANRIEDVSGLCQTIQELNLAENAITKYWDKNSDYISRMNMLETLDLSSNNIMYLPKGFFSRLNRLKEIHLMGNRLNSIGEFFNQPNSLIEIVNLRGNIVREVPLDTIQRLGNLRQLHIDNNLVSSLDQPLINHLKQSLTIQTFGITGNPFQCDCDQFFVQEFINETEIIPDAETLICNGPSELRGQAVYNYRRDDYTCDHEPKLKISFIAIGCIVVAILLAVPCYRYRWYIRHAKVVGLAIAERISAVKFERKCMYDAYVMYNSNSEEDVRFVVDNLRPNIEKETDDAISQMKLKLYLHDRDACPGTEKFTEMLSAIEKSRKIVLVLSNSYLAAAECRGEADLAGREAYGLEFYQPNKILVLVREPLNERSIKAPFTSLLTETVIDVYNVNGSHMKRVWQRVRKFVSESQSEYRQSVRRRTVKERSEIFTHLGM